MKTLIAVLFVCTLFIFHYLPATAQSWKELDSLGIELINQNKFVEAKEILTKALAQAEKEFGKEDTVYVTACYNLAWAYSNLRLYEKQVFHLKEAKKIHEKRIGKENERYADILTELAVAYKNQGFFSLAEPAFIEVLEVIERTEGKESKNYANALSNLASMYDVQGFHIKAEPLHIEAKNLTEKIWGTDGMEYAMAINNIAVTYYGRGLYAEALPIYQEVKEKIGKTNLLYYSIAVNNLAYTYQNLSLHEKAEELFLEQQQVIEQLYGKEHLDYAGIIHNLATNCYTRGLFKKADSLSQIALAINGRIAGTASLRYAESLADVGMCALELKNYTKAESMLVQAKTIRETVLGEEHSLTITSLGNLGSLYRKMKDFERATPLHIKVIKADLKRFQTNFTNLNENQKRSSLANHKKNFYRFFVYLFELIQSQPNHQHIPILLQTTMDFQLQTKGLLLSETSKMRKRILASGDTSLIHQFEKWQAVKSSISKAYNLPIAQREKQGIDLSQLENEANELERRLSARSEDFKAAFNPPIYTFQDLQQKLKPEEVAIEVIRTEYKNAQTDKADTAYLALIVSNQSIRPILLENGKELETIYLQTYQKLMKVSKNPKVFEDTLFYRAFWKPIAEQLGSKVKTVYFSPDGVYHQINLNTLQDPVSKRFVVEENYQIQLLTSLQDLFAEKKANENKTALLVGRPQYSMSKEEYQAAVSNVRGGEELISEAQTANKAVSEVKWGDLPETETEVASVSKLLKERKWAAEVFTGRSALEEQIKKGKNPTILHIATHGYFIPTNSKNQINGMLNSGLVLAGVNTSDKDDKSEDGILTAYEAADLSLDDTDLVVLSACETGLGEVASGEGVYGLQRGFKVAGAKSLIMSLWKVDDTVTQELMKIFYEQWLSGKNKREAFKIAQLQIKNKHKYPYFWGAFVMVGE